ncbi:MAG: MgtC/SapB family protein [Proteobacteria bacterium]|nr:MgtC/SapB family protein [Pseudomonadota bacterium]
MSWLSGDWHQELPGIWSNILLPIVAAICGATVGIERQKKEKSAGLRTMMLVAVGSAVFTMLSSAVAGPHNDPGRIAAQIVAGIGFLGAGAILRGPMGVQGLTTAATIWALAAIGMVVGAGYGIAGLALSVLILGLLLGADIVEKRYIGPCRSARCALRFEPMGGKAMVKIDEILNDYHIPSDARRLSDAAGDLQQLEFSYCHAHKHHREFLTHLAVLPEVREILRSESGCPV